MDKEKVWKKILESIRVSVSPAIFSTWFSQTHLDSLKKSKNKHIAQIGCSSSFVKSTIEGRYYGLIQDSLKKELESNCDVIFIVKENPVEILDNDESPAPLFQAKENQKQELNRGLARAQVRPVFSFDNFAVSSSNQMAWAAAEAVTNDPGKAYNPLFIWGGVGVGKTHLMNAIGVSILKESPESNILFCTGEHFTNDIVEGIRNKSTQRFRNKYRKLEVLLLDDIQFIAGKDAVQEEFFHTFNALVSSGSQIVMTSDKPPHEIAKLEERLRSRFEAGLIVDVSPPDFELRCAIIQIKSKERGMDIPMDLVQIIAGNIDSPRKIEGFLIRLASEAKLKKTQISEDLIQLIMGKGIDINNKHLKATPSDVITATTKHYSVKKRDLLGSSRARTVAIPRQILMYLLRTELNLPFQEVGRVVGRDHTTVMHAVDKITHLASNNVQIRQDILGIKNMLWG